MPEENKTIKKEINAQDRSRLQTDYMLMGMIGLVLGLIGLNEFSPLPKWTGVLIGFIGMAVFVYGFIRSMFS